MYVCIEITFTDITFPSYVAIDKIHKGGHKIKDTKVAVRYAKPPTSRQRDQAVFTGTGESGASASTTSKHTSAMKVAAQQEPLTRQTKQKSSTSSQSSAMDYGEQLASYPGTAATQPQTELQQSSNQLSALPATPHVTGTPEHAQVSPSLSDVGSTTGCADLQRFANMSIFEAAMLPPSEQPVTVQEVERGQSVSGSLDVSVADASEPMNVVQAATTLPPTAMSVDVTKLGSSNTASQQTILIKQQHSVHPAPQHSTHVGPPHFERTGLEHSTDTISQRSSCFGPQHGASVGVQHGAEMGLQHPGIKQSNDQESSIGNSSLPPMGCSPNNTGGSSQPIPHVVEGDGSESAPTQDWPSFPEDEQPSPTTPQSVSQADQGVTMVQVEGVAGLNSKHLEVAFDNEDEGGGEIDDIVLNGDIAIITFKDVNGEGMLPFCSPHGVHVQSLFIIHYVYILQLLHKWHPKLFGR